MATAKLGKDRWIRCAECGHKLGKAVGEWGGRNAFPAIEIKCHSCKTLNYIMMIGGQGHERSGSRTEA